MIGSQQRTALKVYGVVGNEDLGSPWMATVRRVAWTVTGVFNALVGLAIGVGSVVADGGAYGPYLLGTGFGILLFLIGVHGLITKGVRPAGSATRRIRRLGVVAGDGIVIRLRRAPGICGELMLVCFVAMLCLAAGLGFRAGNPFIGLPFALLAVFFAVVVAEHATTLGLRRAVLITPETLMVELGHETVSAAWADLRVDLFEQVMSPNGITVRNRFLEITARGDAPSWTVTRRHRIQVIPKRWRKGVVRVGYPLLDRPEQVLTTLRSLQRRTDEGRRVVLSNDTTLAYLTGDLEISPLSDTTGRLGRSTW